MIEIRHFINLSSIFLCLFLFIITADPLASRDFCDNVFLVTTVAIFDHIYAVREDLGTI